MVVFCDCKGCRGGKGSAKHVGDHNLVTHRRDLVQRRRRGRSTPVELREAVYSRDGNKCVACGAVKDLTLDHIVPLSKGGPTTFNNLQTLCGNCNGAKADGDQDGNLRRAQCSLEATSCTSTTA